ncbi:methionyl-tRNA formyltransferase [Paracnuella aquatica]|uniref:methionyl-tRNA formyltransferase n=1 Tax=Paracnuella aquatica TaxID=2268757 RepID=UPI001F4D8209|nr:methionyl-tRNA formyltransferase [Paracnuella aquatica]
MEPSQKDTAVTQSTSADASGKSFQQLRIVFMGTPEFAVASLDALVAAGCNIVGVVTAPDKPAGRGMQLQQSAVKKYAVDKGLNVLQPEKLKNPEFLEALAALKADLQIVVAFRMLPEIVWNMPPMGTINVHGSLLPHYRGAAPINWAIINGEAETGVTTFKLQHEIDTGNILLQERIPITDSDTAGTLHDKMKVVGAGLLVKTVQALAGGTLQETPQTFAEGEILKHAPKIFTDTCRIDPQQPVTAVYNLVRGLSPYPGAFTQLDGKTLKVYAADKVKTTPSHQPGQWHTDQKTFLQLACTDGYLAIKELQLEGKKRMQVGDFLRGYRFAA